MNTNILKKVLENLVEDSWKGTFTDINFRTKSGDEFKYKVCASFMYEIEGDTIKLYCDGMPNLWIEISSIESFYI